MGGRTRGPIGARGHRLRLRRRSTPCPRRWSRTRPHPSALRGCGRWLVQVQFLQEEEEEKRLGRMDVSVICSNAGMLERAKCERTECLSGGGKLGWREWQRLPCCHAERDLAPPGKINSRPVKDPQRSIETPPKHTTTDSKHEPLAGNPPTRHIYLHHFFESWPEDACLKRARYRVSDVPPYFLVMETSLCTKGWKRSSSLSAAMPIPVSSTEMTKTTWEETGCTRQIGELLSQRMDTTFSC